MSIDNSAVETRGARHSAEQQASNTHALVQHNLQTGQCTATSRSRTSVVATLHAVLLFFRQLHVLELCEAVPLPATTAPTDTWVNSALANPGSNPATANRQLRSRRRRRRRSRRRRYVRDALLVQLLLDDNGVALLEQRELLQVEEDAEKRA